MGVRVCMEVGVSVAVGESAGVGVTRLATPRAPSEGNLLSSSLTETAKPMLATGLPPDVSSILDVVDTNHLARTVDQRPAAVTWIYSCVSLKLFDTTICSLGGDNAPGYR